VKRKRRKKRSWGKRKFKKNYRRKEKRKNKQKRSGQKKERKIFFMIAQILLFCPFNNERKKFP